MGKDRNCALCGKILDISVHTAGHHFVQTDHVRTDPNADTYRTYIRVGGVAACTNECVEQLYDQMWFRHLLCIWMYEVQELIHTYPMR